MRVGILTFSNANNRGAMMQCYALSSKVKELGHDPVVISIALPERKKSIKGMIVSMINKSLFVPFRYKYYPGTTRLYKSAEELRMNPPTLDAVIVGSDQVWNGTLISDFGKEAFFLDFTEEKCRRIAYAASLGDDKWINPDKKILDLISRFDYVSIREDDAVDIVKKNLKYSDVKPVLDPVFLFDGYDQLVGPVSPREMGNRIVAMSLYNTPLFDKVLNDIGNMLEPAIHVIRSSHGDSAYRNHPFVGVKEWLRMLLSAGLIVTNSFHTMAFAIIFKKDFIVVPSFPGRESRMTSLLKKIGLEGRFVKDWDVYCDRKETLLRDHIDYDAVNSKLESLRADSILFLREALS